MTDLQARLLFGLLADLSLARGTPSGRRTFDNVVAATDIPRAELTTILDRLDAEVARTSAEDRTGWTRANDLRRAADIAREVTDEDDSMDPIGLVAPRNER